jgi:hypothetical protein
MRAVNMKYYAKKSSLYKLSDQNYNKKSKIWRMSSKRSKRTLNNPRPPRYADQLFFSNKMTVKIPISANWSIKMTTLVML